jgi:hypothetical protein
MEPLLPKFMGCANHAAQVPAEELALDLVHMSSWCRHPKLKWSTDDLVNWGIDTSN